MPKKKKRPAVKKAVARVAQKKTAAKAAAKKKAPAAKKKAAAVKKKAAAKAPVKKRVKTAAPAKRASATLGRPLVTGEEKLYLLFREDYHARQVFDFLRVETVKELEQFTPQEIVHRLSQPVRQTVEGIRRRLAEKNRCLAGDEEFALQYREKRKLDQQPSSP